MRLAFDGESRTMDAKVYATQAAFLLWEITCISMSMCLVFNCMPLTRAFAFLLHDFQKLSGVFHCRIVQKKVSKQLLKR